MTSSATELRVLAIDPTTRGFAFAVLEGPQRLIDWGVKSVRHHKHALCLARVAAQIRVFDPAIIVLERPVERQPGRCQRVRRLIDAIKTLAAKHGVQVRLVSRREVRQVFATYGASTKHQIAQAIGRQLPELSDRVPRYRKPWMSEDYQMNVFDAVSFALTCFHLREVRRLRRSPHHP
jgi:Holliday junction resolvasome RuvABC endonuclease subunit